MFTLYGLDSNDILDVGAGTTTAWQTAAGGAGNDIYHASKSTGLLSIDGAAETAGSGTSDRIIFKDLNVADFTFTSYDYGTGSLNGNSLRMVYTHANGGFGQFSIANEGSAIEHFEFADGTILSGADVFAFV